MTRCVRRVTRGGSAALINGPIGKGNRRRPDALPTPTTEATVEPEEFVRRSLYKKIRERMLAIARGDYKPKPGEPRIWFTSMKSLAEVLSDDDRALLRVIAEAKPESISALAEITGRHPSNLSRTLKTMSNYGIVELKRRRAEASSS